MRGVLKAGSAFLWFILGSAIASASDVYGGATLPSERTYLTLPTISWNIYSTGQSRIVGGKVVLNGVELPAKYDESSQCVVAVPPKPLNPGKYEVVARAFFNGGLIYKSEWSFEVLPMAAGTLPEPAPEQLRAVEVVNALRDRLGLPPMQIDARLCAAAHKHTEYNTQNKTTGHYERPEMPGFSGEGPAERIQAFGFLGDSYEAVSFGCRSLEESVQSLIDAPYHRIPFFQPGKIAIGAGSIGERLTLDFELGSEKSVMVYPANGQTDVPPAWGKLERPNPLRIHPKDIGVVGYPITLVYYGKDLRLSDVHADLKTDAGDDVPFLLNTPDNDTWLRNAVILMPRKPLVQGAAYVVSIAAKASDGIEIKKTWRFLTAGPQQTVKPPPFTNALKTSRPLTKLAAKAKLPIVAKHHVSRKVATKHRRSLKKTTHASPSKSVIRKVSKAPLVVALGKMAALDIRSQQSPSRGQMQGTLYH